MRHKLHKTFTFKSATLPWVSPGNSSLEFEGFVELERDGKRVIVEGFELHCEINTTNTVAIAPGEDWQRVFDSVTLLQKDKVKRIADLPGDDLRIARFALEDTSQVAEMADMAAGGGATTIHVSSYISLYKPFAENPYAFCMPAELFQLVRIAQAKVARLQTNGNTQVINSATYWVVAKCFAVDHREAQDYSVDTLSSYDFDSQLETKLNVAGRPHGLFLYCPGAKGGQLLTGLTEINVLEEYQDSQLVAPDLYRRYQYERGEATNLSSTTGQRVRLNPFVPLIADAEAPRAVAALLPTGNHANEGQVRDKLRIKTKQSGFTPNPATIRAIVYTVEPRTDQAERITGAKYGAHAVPIAPRGSVGRPLPVRMADEKYLPRKRGKAA